MFNLISFIKVAGYVGIAGAVFAESGLLFGLLLPGDSLLFTAGLLASQGYLNIVLLIIISFIAAVIGDSVGYAIGKKVGPKIFKREKSFWFHPDQVIRANVFFEKHGAKTLILARFLPIIRTFVPMIAGLGTMKYKVFFLNNVIGGALWTVGLSLGGYYLGKVVPNIDHYLLPIIILIIFISVLPTFIHILKDKQKRKYFADMGKKMLKF